MIKYISSKALIGRFIQENGIEDTNFTAQAPAWIEDAISIMCVPNYYVYKPFNIKWMITGSVQTVSNYNRWSVKSTEENTKVYGLDEYLKMNYTHYYK